MTLRSELRVCAMVAWFLVCAVAFLQPPAKRSVPTTALAPAKLGPAQLLKEAAKKTPLPSLALKSTLARKAAESNSAPSNPLSFLAKLPSLGQVASTAAQDTVNKAAAAVPAVSAGRQVAASAPTKAKKAPLRSLTLKSTLAREAADASSKAASSNPLDSFLGQLPSLGQAAAAGKQATSTAPTKASVAAAAAAAAAAPAAEKKAAAPPKAAAKKRVPQKGSGKPIVLPQFKKEYEWAAGQVRRYLGPI